MASGNEVLRHFMNIRKHSHKYAPAFQKLHSVVNGTASQPSLSQLRAKYNNKVGVRVVLGEKSDLGLCQTADTLIDRMKLSNKGVTLQPAKASNVYYGHLAANRNRYTVPSELKYTESSYSSRNVFIWLWTDVQHECPDLYTSIFSKAVQDIHVYSFGHVHNKRGGLNHVGGVEDFSGWLEGRTNIFPDGLDLEKSNVYVMFSDNFLEMYPTSYQKVFSNIQETLGQNAFVRFSYLSRQPMSYNALHTYSFPPASALVTQQMPFQKYYLNVLCNVQRQEYAENYTDSAMGVRMLCHSSLFRADQPMKEMVVAMKTPAEDNAGLAYLDKFGDYKAATNSIFISEHSDKLQLMQPHQLLTYTFGLLAWPETLRNVLSLCSGLSLSAPKRDALFKKTHTSILEEMMLGFDNDASRISLVRGLAYGRPELVEDLRSLLWQYTVIPGTAFNYVKAKALVEALSASAEHSPDGEYYEFDGSGSGPATVDTTPARVGRKSDNIFAIDCEFVRHSISLRGHIHEVNRKQHLSWCKLAPEAA